MNRYQQLGPDDLIIGCWILVALRACREFDSGDTAAAAATLDRLVGLLYDELAVRKAIREEMAA